MNAINAGSYVNWPLETGTIYYFLPLPLLLAIDHN